MAALATHENLDLLQFVRIFLVLGSCLGLKRKVFAKEEGRSLF